MTEEHHRDPILDPPRRRKSPVPTIVGIVFSTTLFTSMGLYFYYAKVHIKEQVFEQDQVTKLDTFVPPPPPPPKPPPPPPPKEKTPPPKLQPRVTPAPPINVPPLPVPPVKKADRVEQQGPVQATVVPPAPKPAPPARPDFILNPDWASKPDGEQLAGLYPTGAAESGISGKTVIVCTVRDDGRVENCSIKSETPSGQGFGRAALQAARYFKMRPQTRNGAPVGGAKVEIPLTWRLEG